MFQVSCAACAASFEYNPDDYIHLCPFCSSGFVLDVEDGSKEIVADHYILPNRLDRDQVESTFFEWLGQRYHRPEKVKDEFKVIGVYGICLPYWVVSLEAHTFWTGHSAKAHQYSGQSAEYGARFLREEGRFSRRYRWSILARKSPKEHWGTERLHHPRENILVDWDGFPLDEALGPAPEGGALYESKQVFKFDHANGLSIAGIQSKENGAIARARDQIHEYHRRMCKTKVGTLQEHRTEMEVVGIHVVHMPFWVLRYAYTPRSVFRYFTPARERRILVHGFTHTVLEAELPLNRNDKVMTNLFVCAGLTIVNLVLAVALHPLFLLLMLLFAVVSVASMVRVFGRDKPDPELIKGHENREPVF